MFFEAIGIGLGLILIIAFLAGFAVILWYALIAFGALALFLCAIGLPVYLVMLAFS